MKVLHFYPLEIALASCPQNDSHDTEENRHATDQTITFIQIATNHFILDFINLGILFLDALIRSEMKGVCMCDVYRSKFSPKPLQPIYYSLSNLALKLPLSHREFGLQTTSAHS